MRGVPCLPDPAERSDRNGAIGADDAATEVEGAPIASTNGFLLAQERSPAEAGQPPRAFMFNVRVHF